MNEYISVLIAVASSAQSLALIYVLIRMIGVTDRALARAQGPVGVSVPLPTPPLAPTPGKVVVPLPQPSPAPTVDLVIDDGLVDFIKKTEAFRSKAYWDYKQWSIGYGTKANSPTETITEPEALERLRTEIGRADAFVKAKFPNLPKGQHQALIDLTFNAGPGWEEQSLGRAVAAQKIDTIKADILQYNHAGGAVNAGLTARREAEVSWFDNPI